MCDCVLLCVCVCVWCQTWLKGGSETCHVSWVSILFKKKNPRVNMYVRIVIPEGENVIRMCVCLSVCMCVCVVSDLVEGYRSGNTCISVTDLYR